MPLFSTRGPGFQMPAASGFAPLPDGVEPSAEQVAEAVAAAADVDAVCFAGVGEPLMKLNVLEAAAKLVRAERPALALRCNTNGLVQETVAQETAERLATAGLGGVSVALASADAAEYAALMEPEPLRFSPVFSLAGPQRGLRLRARVRRGGPRGRVHRRRRARRRPRRRARAERGARREGLPRAVVARVTILFYTLRTLVCFWGTRSG